MAEIAPRTLCIAGQEIALGQTRDLFLRFSESYLGQAVNIPIRVIRGPAEGPFIAVTGAVHGDELVGIGILREILYDEPPEIERGALVCVPVANLFGLEHHTRYLPDRRDLNRFFPGLAEGSMTSRLAYRLFHEVLTPCDYAIDLHSASGRRVNYPSIRADMRNPRANRLARAFGCELIVDSRGPESSLRRSATKAGTPTVTLEAGEAWKIEPGVVELGVRGVWNVLKSMDMVAGVPTPPLFQVTIHKTSWVRANRGGFLGFNAAPGDLVRRGQVLATNYSIFGSERDLLESPCHGIVLSMTTMPAAKPGDPVFHIAQLSEKTYQRVRRTIERSANSDASLYHRILDDFARKVHVAENGAAREG